MQDRNCEAEGLLGICGGGYYAKGLCRLHYARFNRWNMIGYPGEWEWKHAGYRKKAGTKCSLEYCDRPIKTNELCAGHYQQAWSGQELRPLRLRRVLFKDENGRVCTKCEKYLPWNRYYPKKRKDGSYIKTSICKTCFPLKPGERA